MKELVEDFDMIENLANNDNEDSEEENKIAADDYTSGFISRYRKRKGYKKRITHGASGLFKVNS